MKLSERWTKPLDHFVNAIFHFAVWATIAVVSLVCIGIFSRYVLRYPLNWISGVVTLSVNWAVFLMVGVYIYRNQDIVIPYFFERLFGPRTQQFVRVFITLLIGGFTICMGWYVWQSIKMGDYVASISTFEIKYYWYTVPFFAGMLIGLAGILKRIALGQWD